MNDNTVCCQNESVTEPQRDPRRPVCLAQCHFWLPPRGGSRASGWRSLRNKRRCACFEIAIIPLSRALPQASTPPAPSRREPFMCSAQDDLLKWGAALFLRFLGQSRTPVPTRFDCFPCFNACREDIILPPCLTQSYQKPSLAREGGPLAVDE